MSEHEHGDGCETCQILEASEVQVAIVLTDDPCVRRFVPTPWPITETQRFTRAAEAVREPMVRVLWRGGTVEVRLDAAGATVTRKDDAAWGFYAEDMALGLGEQVALLLAGRESR